VETRGRLGIEAYQGEHAAGASLSVERAAEYALAEEPADDTAVLARA